ncbi:uncharacterized protein LOC119675034 [Teleopsis dalmanni]|uniref:uncharacterized protein LOC119675034 n=1 Tax=Teleopsis dalmanni TaxID=139649 RepID=UPI0018CFD75C|nr:uncharacterized protein LOC119675034 [Teleopsis dalmanni]XP_037942135.1 uncharacterized protein LOC119675034 [Teleopsis dalmanni]
MKQSKIIAKPSPPIRAKVIKTIHKAKKNKAKYTSTSISVSSSRIDIKVKEMLLKTVNTFENMDELLLVGKKNLQQNRREKIKRNQSKPHLEKIEKKTQRKRKANIKDEISSYDSSDSPMPRKRRKPNHIEVIGRTRGPIKRKLADVIGVEQNENVEFNAPAQKRQKRDVDCNIAAQKRQKRDVDTNIVQLYYPKSKQKRMIAKKKYLARLEEIRSTPPLTRARKRMMPQEKLWEFIDPPKRR